MQSSGQDSGDDTADEGGDRSAVMLVEVSRMRAEVYEGTELLIEILEALDRWDCSGHRASKAGNSPV